MIAQGGMGGAAGEIEEFSEPVTPVELPEGTRVERDLAYGAAPAQRLDVYLPKGAVTAAPVIFMVHGGAWLFGDKASARFVANKVARWLPKGFILISVNYRLVPRANPAAQADDVAAALAYAQGQAASWGGDASRFVLLGHSAGAHLIGLLAADPAIAAKAGAKPWLGTIMLDSAAMNVNQIMSAPHMRFYDRVFGRDPVFWTSVSPFHRLSGKPQPILLVCSSLREDSCRQARDFADRVNASGGRAAVAPMELTHRQINENLGLAGGYTSLVETFMESLGLS